MSDSSFARNILYQVLELHGWPNEKINQEFNSEKSVKLLNTDVEEEIRCNIKFLEEQHINKDIYINLYNEKKGKELIREQVKRGIDKKIFIEHPKLGRTISEFAREVSIVLKDKEKIFFRPDAKEINEVRRIAPDENEEQSYQGFSQIKPNRFITLIEDFVVPYILVFKKDEGWVEKKKSISSELANTTLCSDILEQSLPHIRRIFGVPLPIMYKGKLTFPKKGYDERFDSWLPDDSPTIRNENMNLEQAKDIIKKIFGEFCFKTEQDFSNALSAFITPFLKGLFPQFNTRCPIFFYLANRERAGKDYLAGVTGILYEGSNLEEPPIATGERNANDTDELRKKILSALRDGRKRLHFQNNKGYLNNPVLEAVATATTWSDRILGKNESLTFENELDISLSGNVGIGYTADFNNRCRKINLFLDIEDANARKFSMPNLHLWIKENRSEVLSALYSLVRNWIDKGSAEGSLPFSSFPDWAKICGGIMETAGYMNPCNPDLDSLGMTGDVETADMKALFELCYQQHPDKWLKKQEIMNIITNSDISMFSHINFDQRADQTKFGIKLNKFVGRWLSNILLKVNDVNIRSSRQELMFTKNLDKQQTLSFGNLGNLGIQLDPLTGNDLSKDKRILQTLPTLPRLPTFSGLLINESEKSVKSQKDESETIDFNVTSVTSNSVQERFADKFLVFLEQEQPIEAIIEFCKLCGFKDNQPETYIERCKEHGLIFEIRPGFLMTVK